MNSATAPKDPYRRAIVGTWLGLVFLVLMNIVGMYLNLWGNIPDYSSAAKAFGSVPLLDAHVLIAFLILANLALLMMQALRPGNRQFLPIGIIALAFASLAIFSGVEFTFFGGNDIFSFTMELGFVGMVGSVGYVLFVVGRR